MKKILIITLCLAVLCGPVFFQGCKKSEQTGEFTLKVTLENGVNGTPAEGTYYYNANTQITYNYSLKENYSNLVVKLDSEDVESSGTFTITGDHSLSALADPVYNILGSWTLTEEYEDNRSFTVTITFTGDNVSGTVTDSDGGVGTYEVDDSGVTTTVTFNLDFPTATYDYDGSFTSGTVDELQGTSTRTSITSVELSGTWKAVRIAGSSALQSTGGKKGDN